MTEVETSGKVTMYADRIMSEIHDDMAGPFPWGKQIPRDVGSFSNVHDYCDANGYLDAIPGDISSDAWNDLANAVLDECDRRLASEALALDSGERCRYGRLARFNGGSRGRGHWIHLDDGSHQCEPCQFCK